MRRFLAGAALLVLALGGGAAWVAERAYHQAGPLPADTAIVVPRGGLEAVATTLTAQGAIRSAWQFEAAAIATRGLGAIRAGELTFPAGGSLQQVLAVLRTAKPIQHKWTVPEGLTALQVGALLAEADAAEGAVPTIAEGSVLPETYRFERGATRAALVARAQRAMEAALAAAWASRAPDLPLAQPRDALILASIVERETGKPEERKLVAAVYLNRLRRGMKLQSDPTVVYGASAGLGVLDHGLTRAELETDTPYNTYRVTGLPPGPICMPGQAAIEAATHPADSADLFFVADGTGGHAFARTEQDHARNVLRWRAAERSRRSTPATATPAPATGASP